MIYISHLVSDEEMKELVEVTGAGVETIDFSIAMNLDNLAENIKSYEKRLKYIGTEDLTVHGPFLDLNPMTYDDEIKRVTQLRYTQSYEAAKALGAKKIVYHSCFYPDAYYLTGWAERVSDFYLEFMEKNKGVEILMENVFDRFWEPFADVALKVNRKEFGLCFDAGHAHCYSKDSATEWVDGISPYVKHVHVHDNLGDDDMHLGLGQGNIAWDYITGKFAGRDDVTYTIECGDKYRIISSYDRLKNLLDGK